MLSYLISTAAATGSVTTCACLDASPPLYYGVGQLSCAQDWTAATHALHNGTDNEATTRKHA